MNGRTGTAESEARALFAAKGFDTLTRIQARAVPRILQKRDCLLVAPTGSGKTEAAAIPVFHRIRGGRAEGKISCLYITPLRALNRDVFRRITRYAEDDGLDIRVRHGDTAPAARRRIAESPPDVLVTTPETAVVLLSQPKMLDALSELRWVVVDEVHELVSSERGSQLSITMERLQANARRPLTRIGLSATLGNPAQAAKFVAGTHRRCLVIRDASVRRYDVRIVHVEGEMPDVADAVARHVKESGTKSPVLLFANTRGEAEILAATLRDRADVPVRTHHGSISRESRQDAEESLRAGGEGIVVCTSSLELGLDIGGVELVVHYGSPRQASKLVQRIGRSRHGGNRSARGLIVTNRPDDRYEAGAVLERAGRGSVESQRVHEAPLDVLAHHMVGLLYQIGGTVGVQRALDIAKEAYPYRNLTADDALGVLDVLDSRRVVRLDRDAMAYGPGRRAFMYHLENLTTIPDIQRFRVLDTVAKRTVGTLDQRFVGDNGEPGSVFVLRGSQWRVLSVDEKALRVNVEPAGGRDVAVPYWEGESMPVDAETAMMVDSMEGRRSLGPARDGGPLSVVAESTRRRDMVVLHACLGTRINATLAALLSSAASASGGGTVRSRSDAYRIVLATPGRISREAVLGALREPCELRGAVTASLAGTHNINWRVWQVAKRFGIVQRGAVYDRKAAGFLYARYSGTPVVREALRELFHDKYDIRGTDRVLNRIREGDMPVRWIDVDRMSALAQPILDHAERRYRASGVDPELLAIVKERLQRTKHRLVCARCGRWQTVVETREVEAIRPCPHCGARQVTATFHSDYELPGIISKRHGGRRLSAEEDRAYRRAWKVSSLIETFGVEALTVLSGYGVGADTGARILRNMVDREYMFVQIYEAERQYVMTRGFWDR